MSMSDITMNVNGRTGVRQCRAAYPPSRISSAKNYCSRAPILAANRAFAVPVR